MAIHALTNCILTTKPAKTSLLGGHFIYRVDTTQGTLTPSSANIVQNASVNGQDVTNQPSQWGYNTHIGANGIKLRYNELDLSQWTNTGLTFYNPSTTSQGNRAMTLDGSNLTFYASDGITPQAIFGGTGAQVRGAITATSLTIDSGGSTYSGIDAINISGYDIEIEIYNDSNEVDPDNYTYLIPHMYHNGVEENISDKTHYIWYRDDENIGTAGAASDGGIRASRSSSYRVIYEFQDGAVGDSVAREVDINPTEYITDINDAGIKVHPKIWTTNSNYLQIDGNGVYVKNSNNNILSKFTATEAQIGLSTEKNILINSEGINIRNGSLPMMTLDNDSLDFNVVDTTTETYVATAIFTSAGAQIGRSGGAHSIIDADGQRFYANDGTTQLANIGYGDVQSQGSTFDKRPYFTFGSRRQATNNYDQTATYSIGDICVYNGRQWCCRSDIETPEPFSYFHWQSIIGDTSFTEGKNALACNEGSHAEGINTKAIGVASHAEGLTLQAIGNYSHAEGNNTRAIGISSHAEGYGSTSIGNHSHAEGSGNSTGNYSHAEGFGADAIGNYSHAEGYSTEASGAASHSEGYFSDAIGDYSHASGMYTEARKKCQTAIGRLNTTDFSSNEFGEYAFIIGNGDVNTYARSNALTVDWNGNVWCAGGITATPTAITMTYNQCTTGSYSCCYRIGNMVFLSFNINVTTATASYDYITGLPPALGGGWATSSGFGSGAMTRWWVTTDGTLRADGTPTAGWHNGNIVYLCSN